MSKRIFDLMVSLLGLIIISPLLIIISFMIKTTSKGPVFYKQLRVGKGGIDFTLLKFRTMKVGSEKSGLLTVGMRDTRITNIGYFLRKYKFDELPQLFNVLSGEMSIVGPRPEVRKYVDLYTEKEKAILNLKPGITDVASIVFRNENDLLEKAENPEEYYVKSIMPQKLTLNLKYIRQNSITSDIRLVFQTIKHVWCRGFRKTKHGRVIKKVSIH